MPSFFENFLQSEEVEGAKELIKRLDKSQASKSEVDPSTLAKDNRSTS